LVAMRLIRETDYLERTQTLGARLREGLDEAARCHGFGLRQTGPVQLPLILFEEHPDMAKGDLWTNALAKLDVYFHPQRDMYISTAMTEADIDATLEAADKAFTAVKAAGGKASFQGLDLLNQIRSGHMPTQRS